MPQDAARCRNAMRLCRNFAAEKSSALMLPTVATTVTSDEKKITSDGTQF